MNPKVEWILMPVEPVAACAANEIEEPAGDGKLVAHAKTVRETAKPGNRPRPIERRIVTNSDGFGRQTGKDSTIAAAE
jgi:hypothetical protein